ncbi:MAG: M20/M25/M40 family metallo-hydrolase [Bacteroidia bacterium]
MDDSSLIRDWIGRQKSSILDALIEFLRFPTVSAQPKYWGALEAAAQWLKGQLEGLGFAVRLLGEPPVVHGHYAKAPNRPTLLLYGHYDVQPPEPLELWESPPFAPRLTAEAIYARGASDDKGQVYAHLAAWRYFIETHGELPVNLHVVLEGQEETGSEALYAVLEKHAPEWRCDAVIVSDTAFFAEGIPTLTVGLRGLVYGELSVEGPVRDLHSGTFGGVVENPIWALCVILAALKGPDGRVRLPDLYTAVRPVAKDERRLWRQLPADAAHYEALAGAPLSGEVGFTPLERIGVRPTIEIHGIWGGYTGEGSKTIIPTSAHAKLSLRLVPHQDPVEVWQRLEEFVHRTAPAGVKVTLRRLHPGAPAFETPTDSPYYQIAAEAVAKAFGRRPVPLREGGSIPILTALHEALGGVPIVLMGFGLPTDAVHSPNEHFKLTQLWQGLEALIYAYQGFGQL